MTFELTRRRFMAGLLTSLTLAAAPPALAGLEVRKPSRKPRSLPTLVLDAGHGGKDPGTIGRKGSYEKTIVLDITKRLAEEMSRSGLVRVSLTRDTDEFIPLKERVNIARARRAELFVSLHADSAPTTEARGLSIYSLSEKASDEFASALAAQENLADLAGGLPIAEGDEDVTAILADLTARHTRNAALKVKTELVRGIRGQWRLLENPIRSANFAVLRAPDIPSILIETGFLSNPQDENLLRDSANRTKIAKLLAGELKELLSAPPFV